MKKAHSWILFTLLFAFIGCSQDGNLLKQEDYPNEWPLTVDQCYVNCVGEFAVIVIADGKKYAVNEAAKNMNQFENIDEITKINPNYPGQQVKMKLSDIEFEGLRICK